MNISRLTVFTAVILLFGVLCAKADGERYVTVSLSAGPISTNYSNPVYYQLAGTNSIEILEGETGELITAGGGYGEIYSPITTVTKSGATMGAQAASTFMQNGSNGSRGTTVAGPATFSITANYPNVISPTPLTGLMTVRITPQTYASDKTVLVAPGMGNVQINLESSTNLNQWEIATNGVYSDNMRFFRVKLTNVN